MGNSTKEEEEEEEEEEDLEPLFDYHRVQPSNFVYLDDDEEEAMNSTPAPKRRKDSKTVSVEVVESGDEDDGVKVIRVANNVENDEDNWLPPPPKGDSEVLLIENSTIKELRIKKQELVSVAKLAEDALRAVEETTKRDISSSFEASLEAVSEKPSKPPVDRPKIVISFQGKDSLKQIRVYKDDKFERIFKLYADKVKADVKSLGFSFDGEKIDLTATPDSLGMEDEDIIEVRVKKG